MTIFIDKEEDIVEKNGERYIDLGGIYALIIDEDNIEDYAPDVPDAH
jgi:hypothetical protein